LTELRTKLVATGNTIRASNRHPSAGVIAKLREAFPVWKFKPACIEVATANGLVIVFPYEWFYLAAAAVPFYKALKEYKALAVQAAGGNLTIIENARNAQHIDQAYKDSIANLVNGDASEAGKIEAFLTNYDSWGGGKSIARQQDDFHVSPILDALGLLAASSGYVVDLCEKLAELPNVSTTLNSHFIPAGENQVFGNLTKDFSDALNVCGFYYGED
jgi:hypothetical protein